MLHAFGHPVATCCDMLGIVNRTSAHARVQHCCTNLAKRLQHHSTSTNVAWKIWPFSNLSQQHQRIATPRNTSRKGGQTRSTCCDMLHWNVAIVWPGLYSSWYISWSSSGKQSEMTKFCVVWRTWIKKANLLNVYFEFIAVSQIPFRDS